MVRRLIIAVLTAALIAPLHVTSAASAAVLFTCPSIDPESFIHFYPGLTHTQRAQSARSLYVPIHPAGGCSNGEEVDILGGTEYGENAVTTYPSRPIGCPVAWGGAGPDYPDQTPILLGATDPSFKAHWFFAGEFSRGIAKVKQGPAGDRWRVQFRITSGKYTPPAGMKTKIRFAATITPSSVTSWTCADDSHPLGYVELESVGPVVVSQK